MDKINWKSVKWTEHFMHKFILFAFALFLFAGNALAFDLVSDEKSKAEIVIGEKPARMARYAATELQTYIEKISGARLPIVNKPSGASARVYVGISSYTKKLGLKTDGLKYGAYLLSSGNNWLALLGPDKNFKPIEPWGRSRDNKEIARVDKAWDKITGEQFRNPYYNFYMWRNKELDLWLFDDRGTLNGVHQFLESLGVRWYCPGDIGEIIPKLKTISVQANQNKIVKPDYDLRAFTWWSQPWGTMKDDAQWRLRLGTQHQQDALGKTQVCHGMKFVHGRKEFMKAYPEAFSLINGKRETTHKRHGVPCLSSELLFKKHLAYARAIFDHFDEPVVSIDVVDGCSGRGCECPICVKDRNPERGAAGALSNHIWGYMNRIAKELYKSHPDKMVICMSYGGYCLPPTNIKQMSPNLAVMLMSSRQTFNLKQNKNYFTKLIKDWKKVLPSRKIYLFENIGYNFRKKKLPLPVYLVHQSKTFFDAVGDDVDGYFFSNYEHRPWLRDKMTWDALATAHLDIYILSKLMWNKNADVDALFDEYCRLFFGPAQKEMRDFINYCELNHQKMRSNVTPIDHALKLLDKAKVKVKPGSIYAKRVALVVNYVKDLKKLRDRLAKPRLGPKKQLVRKKIKDLKFDGKLNDRFWKNVPETQLKDLKTGKLPKVKTSVKMAWADNNSLYIGIRCEEPDMSGIKDTADGTMAIFNGDNIDIHVETPIVDYYQMVISPSGKIFDMDRSGSGRMRFNTKWNSGVSVKVHKGKDFWSAEIQVPAGGSVERELDPNLSIAGDLPTKDAPWYINLGRQRPRKNGSVFSAYVPTLDKRFNDRFLRSSIIVK